MRTCRCVRLQASALLPVSSRHPLRRRPPHNRYMHTCAHAHRYTHMDAHMHEHMPTHTQVQSAAGSAPSPQSQVHALERTFTHACAFTPHMCARVHAHTHARTHRRRPAYRRPTASRCSQRRLWTLTHGGSPRPKLSTEKSALFILSQQRWVHCGTGEGGGGGPKP